MFIQMAEDHPKPTAYQAGMEEMVEQGWSTVSALFLLNKFLFPHGDHSFTKKLTTYH